MEGWKTGWDTRSRSLMRWISHHSEWGWTNVSCGNTRKIRVKWTRLYWTKPDRLVETRFDFAGWPSMMSSSPKTIRVNPTDRCSRSLAVTWRHPAETSLRRSAPLLYLWFFSHFRGEDWTELVVFTSSLTEMVILCISVLLYRRFCNKNKTKEWAHLLLKTRFVFLIRTEERKCWNEDSWVRINERFPLGGQHWCDRFTLWGQRSEHAPSL